MNTSKSKERQIHEKFMLEALKEAEKARKKDEVPVGAVIVKGGKVIARGHNLNITNCDPTAHAEIVALRKASKKLGNHRLNDCEMYVTIEPCPMCAGALVYARLKRLIFAVKDPKSGACGSVVNVVNNRKLNHRLEVVQGICSEMAKKVIQEFFKPRRGKR